MTIIGNRFPPYQPARPPADQSLSGHQVKAAGLATGGGTLDADPTITVTAATTSEAQAGTGNGVLTAAGGAAAIAAQRPKASSAEAATGTDDVKYVSSAGVKNAIQTGLFFFHTGTGATNRNFRTKIRELGRSPTDYGADITGAADSATALTSALAAGQLVRGPKGSYKLDTSVNVPAAYKLMFDYGATWTGSGFTGSGILIDYASGGVGIERHWNEQAAYIQGFDMDTALISIFEPARFRVLGKSGHNGIVGGVVTDDAASSGTLPCGVTGFSKTNRDGTMSFAVFGRADLNTFGGAFNELDSFNWKAPPPTTLPLSTSFPSIAAAAVPITLMLAAGGTYQSAAAIRICPEGETPNSYVHGIVFDPGVVSDRAIYIDANSTSGPAKSITLKNTGDLGNRHALFQTTKAQTNSYPVLEHLNNGGTSTFSITQDGSYYVGSNKVLGARDTGWTAMTGTPDKATAYATGTVTLAQLAGRVASLQAALTAHGIIGA